MPIEDAAGFEELPDAIEKLFEDLKNHESHSDEYAQIMDQIVKLTKVRKEIADMSLHMFEATGKQDEMFTSLNLKSRELDLKYMEAKKPDRVSMDTWAMIGANLAGILVIVGYERFNIIASKALGFLRQVR